ncbi:MAG: extracellular solute-binding protein [Calditrichia bacterium]
MNTRIYIIRIVTYLLLLCLMVTPFSCSNEAENRITIWTTLRPVERAAIDVKLQEFAKQYPGYTFQQIYYQTEELRSNFMVSALAGKGPALVHCASDNVGPLSELQVIRPLDDLFSKSYLDSFLTEPYTANSVFDGKLYQIADRIGNHLCLVYNKKLVPIPPETSADLITMGKELARDNDGDGKPDRYALAWNFLEPYFFIPFLGMYGGWLIDENNQPTLDTDAVVNASQYIYDLANKHKIIPKESDYETANALFLDERAAMIINGPWSWGTYINRGMDIGLARIPRHDVTGQWATPIVSPVGYCMNVNLKGKQLDIATKLLRYLTSSETQLEFARGFNLIPTRVDLMSDSTLNADPLYQAATDQLKAGRPMPIITELRWIWDGMRPAYQGIFTGDFTPEEAAKRMQSDAIQLIKENRE